MTLPALADLDAFKVRLGFDLALSDEPRAQAALEDASALARAEAGVDWITDADPPALDTANIPDIVVAIVLRAARRAFINPDEVESESAGSYQVRFRDVYLTVKECELIRNAGGTTPTGLGVVSTTRGPIETAPLTCDTVGLFPSVEEEDPFALWP